MTAILTASEVAQTATFIQATIARTVSLLHEQRHEDARRNAQGLRRLINTIMSTQADHGFMADILLGAELNNAQKICVELLD